MFLGKRAVSSSASILLMKRATRQRGQDLLEPDKGTDVRVDWESSFEIYDLEGMSSESLGELEGG